MQDTTHGKRTDEKGCELYDNQWKSLKYPQGRCSGNIEQPL